LPTERVAAACVGVGKTYFTESGQVEALRDVDAEFAPGALTAVVGPSGSGKSSLLRILAALEPPTRGRVLVRNHDLALFPESRLRRIRRYEVGYVFQRPSDNFVSYLSLDEHLRLVRPAVDGAAPDPDELLDELQLGHRRLGLPQELSGGEQQRAAFACALMAGARVIVADEPTAELDTVSSEHLLRVVRRLVALGVAVVLATHDRSVMREADAALELEHGCVKGLSATATLRRFVPAAASGRRAGPKRSAPWSPQPSTSVRASSWASWAARALGRLRSSTSWPAGSARTAARFGGSRTGSPIRETSAGTSSLSSRKDSG
jgi:putative ABC transport system ATP-binding protein